MAGISAYAATMLLAAGLSAATIGMAQAAPVYVADEVEITDAVVYKAYVEKQAPLIKSFGGKLLAQGGALTPIEGAPPAPRVVIYVFDSLDKLQAWRNGPEQKELIVLRARSSHFRSFSWKDWQTKAVSVRLGSAEPSQADEFSRQNRASAIPFGRNSVSAGCRCTEATHQFDAPIPALFRTCSVPEPRPNSC